MCSKKKSFSFSVSFMIRVQWEYVYSVDSIPAGMYALYNVLSFYSISLADPTTYFVLLQSRSLATGIIYQILFKKQLSALQEPVENFVPICRWFRIPFFLNITFFWEILWPNYSTGWQWLSLVILTVGTSMKQFSFSSFNFVFNEAIPLILVQIVCACFAGVYNEYLLKARNVDFWVQERIQICTLLALLSKSWAKLYLEKEHFLLR